MNNNIYYYYKSIVACAHVQTPVFVGMCGPGGICLWLHVSLCVVQRLSACGHAWLNIRLQVAMIVQGLSHLLFPAGVCVCVCRCRTLSRVLIFRHCFLSSFLDMPTECFYLRGEALLPDGGHFPWHLKAWRHEVAAGYTVLWDLHAVTDCIGIDKSRTSSKWFHERVDSQFHAFWRLMGLEDSDAFIPSVKSQKEKARQNGTMLQLHPLSHDEFALTTRGLIGMLFAGQRMWKRTALQGAAKMLCLSLLEKVHIQEYGGLRDLQEIHAGVRALCADARAGFICMHLAAARAEVAAAGDLAPQGQCMHFIFALFAVSHECPAAMAKLAECMLYISKAVENGLPAMAYTTDPTKVDVDQNAAGRKRRRVDEDYKAMVVRDAVAGGRASHTAAFLRADDRYSDKNADQWVTDELLSYQSAGWFAATTAHTVCCCFDAGRVGNPAEQTENIAAQLFSWTGNTFMWLPPQVANTV